MSLINNARSLRKDQTDAERLLWQKLRNRQLLGVKFRRQFPIEPYIADFVCLELKLIIELDGSQHFDKIAYDHERTDFLKQRGFKVLRFWNNDAFKNTEGVLESIRLIILKLRYEMD
ncbi:endonuclease domain-containing protein [Methylobacter sp.]|uniref:endonuclease domain-containing protein n=1 Tax=Methylobacter sp. TaxID=2051955 RepID=UPI002487E6CF|nr:endonuclease domain-containing protein [Methylobacter sp.]MDI1276937.1 endonuclease domain-containing protein [Methylobacter sp.]MDI1357601.1 endonuclease domain-containing protein [Methylobacter sp.]